MLQGALLVAVSAVLLLVLQRVIDFRRALHMVHDHPGHRTLLNTLGPIENFFPRIPYVTLGSFHMWRRKHKDFELYGWDVITYVTAFFGSSKTNFYIADADALREITSNRILFPKPIEQYKLLCYFGRNIVASEGEEWKKYRKITAPAFSDRNNKLVWDETMLIMKDLFQNVWGSQEEIHVDHVVDLTLPIALYVIAVAGFGQRVSWTEKDNVPPGYQMSFKNALHVVAKEVFLKLISPEWFLKLGLTERVRRANSAFDDLKRYMISMIQERRASEKKPERADIFSNLLDANEEELDGSVKLRDEELVGNLFIFLIAGHETSAHTMAYMFALLALYPDKQEKLYQETKNTLHDTQQPDYREFPALSYSLAVLYETLRMYPSVPSIPKSVAEDTTITITSPITGERKTIPMPQGSSISIHSPGLHYNPRYWEDPHTFKPERFLGDWPRDAFIPYSNGPRGCLGRRFNEAELVAVLSMMVLNYRIEFKEEPQFANETLDQRRRRIFRSKPGLSLTPLHVPLVFKRRV